MFNGLGHIPAPATPPGVLPFSTSSFPAIAAGTTSRLFVNGLRVSFGERPGAAVGEHRVDRMGRATHIVSYRVGPETLFV